MFRLFATFYLFYSHILTIHYSFHFFLIFEICKSDERTWATKSSINSSWMEKISECVLSFLRPNKTTEWQLALYWTFPRGKKTTECGRRIEFRKSYHDDHLYFIEYLFEGAMFGNDTAALCTDNAHKCRNGRRCAKASPPVYVSLISLFSRFFFDAICFFVRTVVLLTCIVH